MTIAPEEIELHAPLDGPDGAAVLRFADAIAGAAGVAVAFSGGVDSSLTVALAARVLGADRVTAVLGVSPSLAAAERERATRTAAVIGVALHEVRTHELDDERYVANAGNRCYYCKHELYTRTFAEAMAATGGDLLLNGDTADDHRRGDRPGRRAAVELGVRSPLADAGIDKPQVRRIARALRLPVWDKPSAPCLASRVPVNTPVTIGALDRVERAEAALRELGLHDLRVRHRGPRAVVELSGGDHGRIGAPGARARAIGAVRAAGYTEVEIEPTPLERG